MLVLDVGFSDREYSGNDNYIEKHYSYPEKLTALGIDEPSEFLSRYPLVRAVRYDGRRFPFADKEFDLCWSNAVMEHVGDAEAQVDFLKEIKRVSSRAFITTPNRYFPVEVHTLTPLLHYLPKAIFDRYLTLIGKSWGTGDYMHPLSRSDLKNRLSQAGIDRYRLVSNKFAGLTLDFVVLADFDGVL